MDKYINFKQSQIVKYKEMSEKYHNASQTHLVTSFFGGIANLVFILYFFSGELYLVGMTIVAILIVILTTSTIISFTLKCRTENSSLLLEQLVSELTKILADKSLDLEKMKHHIISIETKFMANDGELGAMKFFWPHFLEHLKERSLSLDNMPKSVEAPVGWMLEDPLEIESDSHDFVYLSWKAHCGQRDLLFTSNKLNYEIVKDLGMLLSDNSIVFEKFLRSLNIYIRAMMIQPVINIFYSNAAVKMSLLSFVHEVLQDQPFVEHDDQMEALISEKDRQIEHYAGAFWNLHLRSQVYLGLELALLAMLIPLSAVSTVIQSFTGSVPAVLFFFIGLAVIVYGVMACVTRQWRDLKAKRLLPNLIASLIGIRYSICFGAKTDDEVAGKYCKYFSETEKRYMLIFTEVEAINLVKERVTSELSNNHLLLRQQKDAQAQKCYQKFNDYRELCFKYSVLEVLLVLMIIPIVVTINGLVTALGINNVVVSISIIAIGIVIALEVSIIKKHVSAYRQRELLLLIYQKISSLLSDNHLLSDKDRLAQEIQQLKESVKRATESDDMPEVYEYIKDIIR